MYSWIWRHLPGPTWVRFLEVVVALLAIIALLFFVVFPVIEPYMPFSNDSSVTPGV